MGILATFVGWRCIEFLFLVGLFHLHTKAVWIKGFTVTTFLVMWSWKQGSFRQHNGVVLFKSLRSSLRLLSWFISEENYNENATLLKETNAFELKGYQNLRYPHFQWTNFSVLFFPFQIREKLSPKANLQLIFSCRATIANGRNYTKFAEALDRKFCNIGEIVEGEPFWNVKYLKNSFYFSFYYSSYGHCIVNGKFRYNS